MDKKDATVFSIRKANGEVDGVVWSLLDRANDGQEPVRISIARAIFDIGLAQPDLVLSSLIVYVQKNSGKIAQPHRIILLNLLVRVLESAREKLNANKELGLNLVEFSTREMVATKEDQPDWQQPVSTALVLLSQHFCNEVIESILRCFKPGEMPHFFIVKTMADVAAAQGVLFTLRMRECLSRLIPVLSAVKAGPQKWVFAAALGRFAEAYTQFAANADDDSKKQVMPQTFAQDMCTAFDVILLHWLQHKEARVRFAVAESLGYMLATVDSKAFTERLSKLVPAYLLMYKNEPWAQHLPISHGFCSLLLAAGKENAQTLDPLYNTILQGLHPLVSRPPDMKQPSTMKNHNELLRCFEIIARANMDAVLVFLVGRFQLKDSFSRVGSLVVLRHLVNSMDNLLADKKPMIMSSVTTLVGEPDKQVKKAMMQLIVSMANQNYMQLDGGQILVKFIVQQCAISPALIKQEEDARKAAKDTTNDGATNLQIRNAGNHILHVMTTKVPNTHPVLWPYLLEMINDAALQHSFLILIQCIHELAKLKRDTKAPDYAIHFEQKVNIPSPQTILSRLMIMGSVPFRQKGLGAAVINCMQSLGPIIHEGIGKYWDESMPALLEHLESQTEESFNLSKWQDTLLRLFKETVAIAAEKPQWLRDLAAALCEQFKQYKDDHQLHRVIHRYLGALLASVDDKKVINTSLDTMLNTVNHADDTERQGVSQGLGFCGSKHLDTVLPIITGRLDKINKTKSSGWFGGDAEAALSDRQKSTLVLAYGYVTAYADSELILSRLDPHVLHNVIPVMAQAKTVELKTNIIKAVDLIGKSLHVSRLPENKQKYVLQQRDNLMTGVLAFLEEKNVPPPSNQLRMLGLNALSTLVNLEPPIKEPLRKKLLDTVLPFYALHTGPAAPAADEKDKKTAPAAAAAAAPAQAGDKESLEMVITNLNTLLSSLVHMEPNVTTLLSVLQRLEFWIVSKKSVERERSCATYMVLLKKFVHKITHENVKQTEKALPHLGHYLATLLPRATDSNLGIRQTAVENVQAVLYINQLLQNPDDRAPAQEIRLITELRNRMDADSVDKRLAVARDLAMLLTGIITIDELPQLLLAMLPGLCDPDVEAARGVAEVFAGLLSKRATELLPKLEPLIKALVEQLKKITKSEVSRALLQSFRILTRTHFLPVMAIMLRYPVPLAKEVVDCFVSLVNDVRPAAAAAAESPSASASASPAAAAGAGAGAGADAKDTKSAGDAKEAGAGAGAGSVREAAEAEELAANTFKHLYLTCNETPFEKDKPCAPVQTAIAALAEMMAVREVKKMVHELYPALFCTLLMRVGTAFGVDKGASSTDAVRALRVFLLAAEDQRMVEAMDKEAVWKGLESKNYDDAVTSVTKIFCTDHVTQKRPILAFIGKYFTQQSYFGQRSVVTSLLAEFINHSRDDSDLLKELILFLLPRVADKNEKVRKQALRGLGNLVSVWNNEVSQSAASVLSALTSASEDADSAVAAEAVSSLTKVAGVVDEYTMGSMLINICFRMRPAFDRADVSVRTAAFRLFGALCRFGKPLPAAAGAGADGDIKIVERPMAGGFARESLVANFMDQLHTNVPIYLVHLNDDEEKVRAAALDGFKAITELMAPELHKVVDDTKRVDKDSFDDFVSRAAPLLAAKFADRLRGYTDAAVGYFGSTWQGVRGNAVMVAAHLMASTLPADRNKYSLSSVTANVLKMMSQENPAVRSRTAKALSLLHNI